MSEDRLQSANFNRPPRIPLPDVPPDEIDIPPPPNLPEIPDQNVLISIIPVMGIGVMAMFYVFRAGSAGGGSAFFAIPLLLLAVFTIGGTILAQRWRRRDYERRRQEMTLNYISILEKKRARLQAAHDAQVAVLSANFFEPKAGLNLVLARDNRLWERRPDDSDFMAFRLGVGRIPSPVKINVPDPDLDSPELDRALALADAYRFLHGAPVITSLHEHHAQGIYGRRNLMLKAVRAFVAHLVVSHAPQDLHVYLIAPRAHYEDWRWLEWLPHASQQHRAGSADLIAFDTDDIRNLLGNLGQIVDERKEHAHTARLPHLLVIIDGPQLADSEAVYSTILKEGAQVGASALCLVNNFESVPGECSAVLEIKNNGQFRYALTGANPLEITGSAIDQLSTQDAEHIARALSGVTLRETGGGGRIPRYVDFLDLYGVRYVEDLRDILAERWRRPITHGALPHPVPVGRESLAVATEMLLDEDHHGPHGVLAGTTGSGKSEMLQTLVCALALEHDPRLVNLLLIDFKGGSAFNVFADLPHTVGMVTNLDGEQVARALEALRAETYARQQFLKKMNVRDITQYHRYFARTDAHVQDPSYEALPHLFIIVDEFAQLAKEMPDFLRELVRTAQVGRSLGLHLILGTQSPMDVITDEMNANLQFRICLRVQNIEASRAMLRRPDAAYLPAGWPGRGFFQVGERGMFKQFQTAYAGGDYQPRRSAEADEDEPVILELMTENGEVINLLPDAVSSYPSAPDSLLSDEPYTTARAITETIRDYSAEQRIPSQSPLLLPPLEERITLLDAFNPAEIGGWNGRKWLPPGSDHTGNPIKVGSAPVGLLDDVYNRQQNPLWIHLNSGDQERVSRKDGHVLVLGGPGTGKTTFIRTLALSEALLHPPDKLQLYFLSFTGGGLNELGALPHAESVVHGTETERVRRLFGRLIHLLDARQAGREPAHAPTMVLCIDQYEQFRDTYYDQHMPDLERLINEGRGAGIYLVITASSITAVPERMRSLIQQRIALQLGNPTDYLLAVGHLNTQLERSLPNGRGFIAGNPPLACQISLPCRLTVAPEDREVVEDMGRAVAEMQRGYLSAQGLREADATPEQKQYPAPIRELPAVIHLGDLSLPERREDGQIVTALGRHDDDALSLYTLDWWEDGPHFIVTGPPGSGKTNLLHAAVLSAARQFSPDDVRFLLVDFNGRSLRALDPLKHVIRRVTDVIDLQAQLLNLQSEMNAFYARWRDRDGSALTHLPRTVIVIDDYDATSEALSSNQNLLRQLRDHVRLHTDFGLHVWIAGYLERIGDPLIKHLLLRRSGFAMQVKESLHNLSVRTSGLPNEAMPEGRAYFAQHNTIHVVQTALVENVPLIVSRTNEQVWRDQSPARWQHPASKAQVMGGANGASKEDDSEAESAGDFSLDIDTEGLIQDLLGGQFDE